MTGIIMVPEPQRHENEWKIRTKRGKPEGRSTENGKARAKAGEGR